MVGLTDEPRLGSAGSALLLRTSAIRVLLAHPPNATVSNRGTLAGTDTVYLVSPIREGATTLGTMIVASDLSQLASDRNRVLTLVIGEALVALVAAVAGSYLLLRRLLRNIGRITTTAASIESGDLDRRLGDQGTDDEVGQLAATFDSMLDRLQAAMTIQRRLLSDVSHQLRTPLTVARGHLEVLARRARRRHDRGARNGGGRRRRARSHARARRAPAHARARTRARLPRDRAPRSAHLPLGAARLGPGARGPPVVARAGARSRARRRRCQAPGRHAQPHRQRGTRDDGGRPDRALRDPRARRLGDTCRRRQRAWHPRRAARPRARALPRLGSADRDGSGLGLAIVAAVADAHGGAFELAASGLGGCRAAIVLPASLATVGEARVPVVL